MYCLQVLDVTYKIWGKIISLVENEKQNNSLRVRGHSLMPVVPSWGYMGHFSPRLDVIVRENPSSVSVIY